MFATRKFYKLCTKLHVVARYRFVHDNSMAFDRLNRAVQSGNLVSFKNSLYALTHKTTQVGKDISPIIQKCIQHDFHEGIDSYFSFLFLLQDPILPNQFIHEMIRNSSAKQAIIFLDSRSLVNSGNFIEKYMSMLFDKVEADKNFRDSAMLHISKTMVKRSSFIDSLVLHCFVADGNITDYLAATLSVSAKSDVFRNPRTIALAFVKSERNGHPNFKMIKKLIPLLNGMTDASTSRIIASISQADGFFTNSNLGAISAISGNTSITADIFMSHLPTEYRWKAPQFEAILSALNEDKWKRKDKKTINNLTLANIIAVLEPISSPADLSAVLKISDLCGSKGDLQSKAGLIFNIFGATNLKNENIFDHIMKLNEFMVDLKDELLKSFVILELIGANCTKLSLQQPCKPELTDIMKSSLHAFTRSDNRSDVDKLVCVRHWTRTAMSINMNNVRLLVLQAADQSDLNLSADSQIPSLCSPSSNTSRNQIMSSYWHSVLALNCETIKNRTSADIMKLLTDMETMMVADGVVATRRTWKCLACLALSSSPRTSAWICQTLGIGPLNDVQTVPDAVDMIYLNLLSVPINSDDVNIDLMIWKKCYLALSTKKCETYPTAKDCLADLEFMFNASSIEDVLSWDDESFFSYCKQVEAMTELAYNTTVTGYKSSSPFLAKIMNSLMFCSRVGSVPEAALLYKLLLKLSNESNENFPKDARLDVQVYKADVGIIGLFANLGNYDQAVQELVQLAQHKPWNRYWETAWKKISMSSLFISDSKIWPWSINYKPIATIMKKLPISSDPKTNSRVYRSVCDIYQNSAKVGVLSDVWMSKIMERFDLDNILPADRELPASERYFSGIGLHTVQEIDRIMNKEHVIHLEDGTGRIVNSGNYLKFSGTESAVFACGHSSIMDITGTESFYKPSWSIIPFRVPTFPGSMHELGMFFVHRKYHQRYGNREAFQKPAAYRTDGSYVKPKPNRVSFQPHPIAVNKPQLPVVQYVKPSQPAAAPMSLHDMLKIDKKKK